MPYETKQETEKAVVIGLLTKDCDGDKLQEYFSELEFLAQTAGVECVKRFSQRAEYPNPRIYVGQGKLQEIADYV